MDRYKDENEPQSRTDLNQELYQNVSNNAIYANITDVTNANAFEISNNNQTRTTREAYQQMQKYQNMEPVPRSRKELEDFNYLYQKRENKIYDINSVLEEARRNRQEKDDKEEKRKLKNNEYNILSGVNKEELEKYREEKKKRLTTPEEDEIRELIDTIASKTLAGEIDKATSVNLLSDLMATSMLDKVEASSEIAEEEMKEAVDDKISTTEQIEETQEKPEIQEIIEVEDTKEEKKDPDFYTRSMDLSEKDFNLSDEFKEKSLPLGIKILIFLIIIAIIAVTGYFIYKRFI
jgi:hypothetical protein